MDGNKVKVKASPSFQELIQNPMFSDVKRLVKELQSIMSGGNTFKYFLPNNNLILLLSLSLTTLAI